MSREGDKKGNEDTPTTPSPLDVRSFITPDYVARLKRLAARGKRAEEQAKQARKQEQAHAPREQ